MARKKKIPEPPSKAYLISFGDTMTALLAFFIVLNSLAQEQTGAKLHAGTGSFVSAFAGKGAGGTPGEQAVSQSFQMPNPGPKYVIPAEDDTEGGLPSGIDDIDQHERVINRQEEDFQRFIAEIKRLHQADQLPDITGQVTFDIFARLPANPPYMNPELKQIVLDSAPMFRRKDHSVQLTVWATMPSLTAWNRAVKQANGLREEIRELLGPSSRRYSIEANGQPWISESDKRPGASLVISRLGPASGL